MSILSENFTNNNQWHLFYRFYFESSPYLKCPIWERTLLDNKDPEVKTVATTFKDLTALQESYKKFYKTLCICMIHIMYSVCIFGEG